MTVMLVTESAAHAGAALLDERRPGWFREIDLGRLGLQSCRDCSLGQLYGDYWTGLRAIGVTPFDDADAELGFAMRVPWLAWTVRGEAYAELTAAWRDEILRRREQSDVEEAEI